MPINSTANSNKHWPTWFPCLCNNRMERTSCLFGFPQVFNWFIDYWHVQICVLLLIKFPYIHLKHYTFYSSAYRREFQRDWEEQEDDWREYNDDDVFDAVQLDVPGEAWFARSHRRSHRRQWLPTCTDHHPRWIRWLPPSIETGVGPRI